MIELSARNLFKSTIHSTLFEPNDLQCDDKSVLVTPRNWERIEKKTSQEALKINVINFNVSTPTLVSLKLPFIQRMNYLLQRSNLENHQPANDAVVFHHLFTDKFIWFQACLTLRISPWTARWVFLKANKKCYFSLYQINKCSSHKKITEQRQRLTTQWGCE